jgi:hypothetical protein
VHARQHDPAQDDKLDARGVEQRVGDVQGIGDDGSRTVDPLESAMVEPSSTRPAAASPMARFQPSSGSSRLFAGPGNPCDMAAPP